MLRFVTEFAQKRIKENKKAIFERRMFLYIWKVVSLMNEKTNDRINGIVGVAAGYSTYKYAPKLIKKPYINSILKSVEKIPKEDNDIFIRSAQKAFEGSNIKAQGVKILNVDNSNFKAEATRLIKEKNKKHKTDTEGYPWLEKLFKKQDKKLFKQIKEIGNGKNACYAPWTKEVLLNEDKMAFSIFHEIGHAINHNGTGIKHFLNKSRNIFALAAPVFLAIGLLKRKQKNDNSNEIKKPGLGDFIKKHCGLLVGLCLIPKVAEEGLASLNGQKMAKDVLNKDLYKKLVKLNTKAWGSYVLGAALTAGLAQLAVYIKDRIVGDN